MKDPRPGCTDATAPDRNGRHSYKVLSNMGQVAGETAVLPVLDVSGKGGVAEVQPDRFDQDDFDATAYINELFPTGTRVLCYDY